MEGIVPPGKDFEEKKQDVQRPGEKKTIWATPEEHKKLEKFLKELREEN